jgi:serine/threonine-protein kinase
LTLIAGTRLGPYEILAPLGAGGMGEVYRARDSRLSREVAIKVLPEAVVRDTERLARFRREAQVLASLNHPHIASIYGLEEQNGQEALILELVEGETLAERIARGSLPVEEALEIARQIARALEAAHERGIVHRDLKPANVKLDRTGQVKVLDFGLAKALSSDGSSPDITSSPTLTAASTQAGVIIGTAAYMSPEQARGKSVDKRADIWAFATVLYEMLAGRKAFEGETVSDTLAAVLTKDPDWSALPAETPASVRRVLRRCLNRDPKTRIHDIADARLELDEPLAAPAAVAEAVARTRSPLWPIVAALVFALLAAVGWWRALQPKPAPPPRVTTFAVAVPGEDRIPFDDSPVLELSRDGRHLVFIGEGDGIRRLYVRSRDRIEAKPVSGTEGAFSPFFSPDGQWIGFFADRKLKKIPIGGGSATVLAEAPSDRGGAWLDDDTIVFAPTYTSGLSRISARGGKVETLTTPDARAGERSHRWPTCVPGSGAVLFTVGLLSGPGNYDDARIALWEPGTRATRVLYEGGSMARVAGTSHLVFWRGGAMLAVGFDRKAGTLRGEPVVLTEKTSGDASSGVAYAAFAAAGTFAFVPPSESARERRLVLTDRAGKPRPVPGPPREYHYPRFSPDGKRLAVSIGPGHGHADDVWICDVETGALTRLTFGDANGNYYPVWSPDGKRMAYSSERAHQGTYIKSLDGAGHEEPLFRETQGGDIPSDWSRDGASLAVTRNFPVSDVLTVSLKDRRVVTLAKNAGAPVFSPDGRWIAYTSLATGSSSSRPQIVVQPSGDAGGKVQLTSDMGYFSVWTDRELFYLVDRNVVAVEAETSPTFRSGPPRVLFEMLYDRGTEPLREFDVTRDGQTFVFVGDAGAPVRRQVDVTLDWTSELARQLPERTK